MELKISEDEHLNGILITGNFTADRDKALVWSGEGNREKADILREQGYQTIEDTQGGKALNQALPYEATLDAEILGKIISKDDYDRYWSEASNRFSTSQEGDITTRVVGALEDRDFRAVELPNFLADKEITSINGIPREELSALYQTSPVEAFNSICEAEQSRTLRHDLESQGTDLAEGREADAPIIGRGDDPTAEGMKNLEDGVINGLNALADGTEAIGFAVLDFLSGDSKPPPTPEQQAEMNKAAEREARVQAFRERQEEYRQQQERDREAGQEQDQGRGLRR